MGQFSKIFKKLPAMVVYKKKLRYYKNIFAMVFLNYFLSRAP